MARKGLAWRVLLVAFLVGFVPLASSQGATMFEARGSYVASSGASALLLDACISPAQNGLDSSCTQLPPVAEGHAFDVAFSGVLVTRPQACFYDAAGSFLDCAATPGFVPEGAREVALMSMTGALVDWTLRVYR